MVDALSRNLFSENLRIQDLESALTTWFAGKNMDVVAAESDGDHDYVLLAKSQKGGWRKMTGLAVAVLIRIKYNDPSLEVSVQVGDFDDKAVVAAAGIAGSLVIPVLWPLAATAAVGTLRQKQLPEKCMAFIEDWLRSKENSRGPDRFSAPISSARDHSDDYNLVTTGDSPPSPLIDEDDLILSDYDTVPTTDQRNSDGEVPSQPSRVEQQTVRRCPICGASAGNLDVVCPKGHRLI
jgi:hypothetical protein